LSLEKHTWNMKALWLTIEKVCPML
jgi:hypothetical protein